MASRFGWKVFACDCGSTNGTFLNGEQVAGEREANTGDRLRVGPLEFDLKIESGVPGTIPAAKPAVAAKPAAKPVTVAAKAGSPFETVPSGGTVILKPGEKIDDRASSTTIVDGPGSGLEEDPDHAAALLLGLDDAPTGGTTPTVESFSADPTTVMEMPALGSKPAEAKKEEPKKANTDSSSAAAEVLSKYMRRPRT